MHSKRNKYIINNSTTSIHWKSNVYLPFHTLTTQIPKDLCLESPKAKSNWSCSLNNNEEIETQMFALKKLKQWDIDNLKIKKKGINYLYTSLSSFYTIKKQAKEQKKLDSLQKVLQSKANYNQLISKANQSNRILELFHNANHKEQGSILSNNISKTKNIFNNTLSAQKTQNAIQSDLNIDVKTLNTIKLKDVNAQYYREVIKEKTKYETNERNDMINLAKEIYLKKEEKKNIESGLTHIYAERDKLSRIYHDNLDQLKEKICKLQVDHDNFMKTGHSSKEYQMKMVSDKLLKNNEIELQQKEYTLNYNKDMMTLKKKKESYLLEMKHIGEEINYMKIVYEEILQEQKQYYLDILSKGYDSRNEGLVWVVKKLIEMDTTLEYHHFPKFLDHNETKYLQSLAQIFLEETQMKIIMQALKKKQIAVRMQETNKRMNQMNQFLQKIIPTKSNKLTESNENIKGIEVEIKFNKIYQKHQEAFKFSVEHQYEENRLDTMLIELKKQLFGNNIVDDERNVLLNFFIQHQDQKDLYELILLTRKQMKEIEERKEEMQKKEYELFKEKQIVGNLHQNVKFSMENELRKSALFGCGFQF